MVVLLIIALVNGICWCPPPLPRRQMIVLVATLGEARSALRLREARLTDADSGRTIGLDIERLTLHDPRAPGGLRLLCYDAGGHDEYQQMHRTFLTPDTLYVLVWNVAEPPLREGEAEEDVAALRELHARLAGWASLIQAAAPLLSGASGSWTLCLTPMLFRQLGSSNPTPTLPSCMSSAGCTAHSRL